MAQIIYNIFRFTFAGVFLGIHAALIVGLVLERMRDRFSYHGGKTGTRQDEYSKGDSSAPEVSVIIPVHNESGRMSGMLSSLSLQEYTNAEFIFVDDRSSDGSAEMLLEFAKGRPRIKILALKENPAPNHKQFALEKGIAASRGEFILLTDADCEVPQSWISSMVKLMADRRVGAALGPVLKKSGGRGFFHLYQCFDHAVRYIYLAGAAGVGAAGGGFGNNMIIRRTSLEEIGGYSSIPPSPTEDAALVSRMRSHSKYKIRAALEPGTHVITSGEKNWKDFIAQTVRWNNGGLFSPDPATRFNFRYLMISITVGVLAIPLLPFVPSLWPLSLAVMLVMLPNTTASLYLFGASLPKKGAAYIVQGLFTPLYFAFLTILGFCGVKPKWKGDKIR